MKNHDFTNILMYFKQMKELRAQETMVRDHCLSEMEAARARVDIQVESVRLMKSQLEECEILLEQTCLALNKEYAVQESIALELAAVKRKDDTDLCRLEQIVDSYVAVEEYRQQKTHLLVDSGSEGGPVGFLTKGNKTASQLAFREAFNVGEKESEDTAASQRPSVPLTLHDPSACSLQIQALAKKLQLYKNCKDRYDNRLRKCATRLYKEGVQMRAKVRGE